jgi:opine dehydrogenase
MNEEQTSFTILGAGHGGHAMAADLSLRDYKVKLYSYSGKNLNPILKTGGIDVSGVVGEGFAKLELATTNVEKAIYGADVLMVNVAAPGHERYLDVCLPHLKKGQVIVFNTGYFAAIRFADKIEHTGALLAEIGLLPYVALLKGPGRVHIYGLKKKNSIPFAVHPPDQTHAVLKRIKQAFPQLYPASNVLETSLDNMNFILHPSIYVLNAGEMAKKEDLAMTYPQWTPKPVADVIDAFDKERIALGRTLGLELVPAHRQFSRWYGACGETIHETLANSEPHSLTSEKPFLLTPQRLRTLIDEDLPFGLVPLLSLSKELNVPMPCTKALVDLASILDQRDYIIEGIRLNINTLRRMKLLH